ncbi:MAG: hypothetical protein EXS55_00940 [Candidatus Magasanikbacteria bacterium]|nr:hypothetical protein [Candidatus Magasanikbacteria bacterium]
MEIFPGLTIDFSFWGWFMSLGVPEMAVVLFAVIGWVVLILFFVKALAELWVKYREDTKYIPHWEWVVLAVDIPPLFIQTPKAVEQIFAHLSGAVPHISLFDKFWLGKKQKWFSFEIVSIEGYIQFLVRTEVEYRDLIEAAIYAQYTEAEITEVEDYIDAIPSRYPNAEYDMIGVEFKLADDDAYPIRTYENFEYNLSKDAVFSDPMAAILENFTRLGHGENLWMQLIIEPTNGGWKEKGIDLVKKLMGNETHHSESIAAKFASIPMAIMTELGNVWHWNFEPSEGHEEDRGTTADKLTPGAKKTVEAIEDKISKIGFKTKMRVLYAARKEVFHPNRCIDGFVGSLSQFHMQNRNSIVPYMNTHASYDRHHTKSYRMQNTFVKTFKKRKMRWKKSNGYILNIEELATIWHFPLPFVKTPLLQKAGYKRAEPPTGLPVEWSETPLRRKGMASAHHEPAPMALPIESDATQEEGVPPENLLFG